MKSHRVDPDTKIKLTKIASDDTGTYDAKDDGKTRAQKKTEELLEKLGPYSRNDSTPMVQALLIVLQGMDTSGKDGTIKHVMSSVNPQGCRVTSFKAPSTRDISVMIFYGASTKKRRPKGILASLIDLIMRMC